MNRFRFLFLLQVVAVFLVPREIFGQEVTSVSALQKGNNIEISYELKSEVPCDVQAFVSLNNGRNWIGPLSNVKGDIGDFILAGNRHFEWEVLKSQDDLIGSEIKFKIVATKVDPYKPKMVFVKGGNFQMGSEDGESDEMPIHEVAISSFEIGKYEVTQYEWKTIMGNNPSFHKNCDDCPVESVSWYEIQEFLNRLSERTGDIYRLPTEAEWEYAAKGGVYSKQYTYSGSNIPNEVSWYGENSGGNSHSVGELLPNELGLYDMSGNAQERCWDWTGPYESENLNNPKGLLFGRYKAIRGGSWSDVLALSRISDRDGDEPVSNGFDYGFRVVKSKSNFQSNFDYETSEVSGGTFQMGSDSNGDYEKPIHKVTLSSYCIGKYEITQAQWRAVMGSNPSFFQGCDQCPVDQVSYNAALLFIERLNQITGKFYRLPSEAEWEFAAMGGEKSKGFIYSGSNNIDDVAWYDANSVTRTNEVGKKKPNELGIYDMSGNVQELCVDFQANFPNEKLTNPFGPNSGPGHIMRGGGYNVNGAFAQSKIRNNIHHESVYSNVGLRLVLPIFNLKTIEPEMVIVEGGTFQMGSNSGEEDEKPVHAVTLSSFKMAKYEVTQAQWKAVMGNNPSQFSNCDQCPVENVSFMEIQQFLERLNTISGKHYRLPTEAEWEYAARGGKKSKGHQFSGSNDINLIAWCDLNSNGKTQIVGLKKPNELGIFDMSGNVWEWCSDVYGNYNKGSEENPTGPSTGQTQTLRGGSWIDTQKECTSSHRRGGDLNYIGGGTGFRLVLP